MLFSVDYCVLFHLHFSMLASKTIDQEQFFEIVLTCCKRCTYFLEETDRMHFVETDLETQTAPTLTKPHLPCCVHLDTWVCSTFSSSGKARRWEKCNAHGQCLMNSYRLRVLWSCGFCVFQQDMILRVCMVWSLKVITTIAYNEKPNQVEAKVVKCHRLLKSKDSLKLSSSANCCLFLSDCDKQVTF